MVILYEIIRTLQDNCKFINYKFFISHQFGKVNQPTN